MRLLDSLLSGLKAVCASFPDPRKGRGGNIAIADFGLSAFAMLFMQSLSFLAFQRKLEKGQSRSNCQTLFDIKKIPSDNYIRKMLDDADPNLLQPCFEQLENLFKEPKSELKQHFNVLDDRILVAMDGTEFFKSYKLGCEHCSTRVRANGETQCFHTVLAATIVSPNHHKVVPLFGEFISPQDGAEKQDCERNAIKRWHVKHGSRLSILRAVYLGDDIFACNPVIEMLRKNGDNFIFTAKESTHKMLYDFKRGAKHKRFEQKVKRGKTFKTYRYRWFEAVPIRDGDDAELVNWIGFEILDAKGHVTYSMAWVTSLEITEHNVAEIVACGRARWKIENENFNVLKNHGNELEHNFGHGEKFLSQTLATLNFLAFSWHNILDILEPPWKIARKAAGIRTEFFANLLMLTTFAIFPSWQSLLQALAAFTIPPEFLVAKKIE
jgi:hypothetical protein